MPYNGYLHLVPRLTAWFALEFDPRWLPAIFNGVAFGIWLVVALALFSPRVRLPAKPGLALALALVPHTGEVFANLTNVQWPLALGLVLLLTADDANTPVSVGAYHHAAVLLCGLTGPFLIFLSPLFAIRAVKRRSRESFMLLVVVVVVAAVQAALIYRFRHLLTRPEPRDPIWLLSVMSGRLYGTFAGYGFPRFQASGAWIVMGSVLTALLGLAVLRPDYPGPGNGESWPVLCFAWHCRWRLNFYANPAVDRRSGDRYFFLPHVLRMGDCCHQR